MMYPPEPVEMTDPSMFRPDTASSTCVTFGWLAKLTVNSVPPAKSMPSRKCRVLIEMMPGMMISSEIRKNQLRRPTMSSRRTLGGAFSTFGAGSSAFASSSSASSSGSSSSSSAASSACSALNPELSSAGSSTVDSQKRGPAEAGRGQHDVSHDDRGDEARDDTDTEDDREALHLCGSDESQDHACDQGRRVRVADGGPRAPHRRIDSGGYGAACPHLFFEAFKDKDVGVHRHTHGQDEASDPCQRQRDR